MQQLLVGSLTFISIFCIGGAVLTAGIHRRAAVRRRLEQTGPGRVDTKRPSKFLEMLRRVGEVISVGPASARLQQGLAKAGYHSPSSAKVFLGVKALLLLLAIGGTTAAAANLELKLNVAIAVIAIVSAAVFLLPNMIVSARRRERTAELRMHLPDAVDLLEICVTAGMSLDSAWNMVAKDIRNVSPALADEMSLTTLEMHLGSPRLAAMKHMCERVDVEEIESLVIVLVQSERFGTNMADALMTFTKSMRELRSMRAQEITERMAVRLLFPMVMFIFPAVFIVLVGPAAIMLAQMWN